MADKIFNRRASFKYGKIGVLMGGPSSEREISLKSGSSVYKALKEAGLNVVAVDIKTDNAKDNLELINATGIDCAFIALHGYFGEDGQIQEILDIAGLPYTGSGAMASKLAMDKVWSRQLLEIHGLNVPRYRTLDKASFSYNWSMYSRIDFPMVVKPASAGSSIGLSIVEDRKGLDNAVDCAFAYDERIIIEEYISGREFTVGILEDKALPAIEIVPKNKFFDYEAKYTAGFTDYIVPARVDNEVMFNLQSGALATHRILGCFSYSRTDMILGRGNLPFVLELNSIPGLTPTSLLPKAAALKGVDFTNLCIKLLDSAYEKTKNRRILLADKEYAYT